LNCQTAILNLRNKPGLTPELSISIVVGGPAWQGELGMDTQHDFWVMTATTLGMVAVCSIAFAVVVQLH
jgi:hypothetical protein